jgi:hypothetical protein
MFHAKKYKRGNERINLNVIALRALAPFVLLCVKQICQSLLSIGGDQMFLRL